jgi:uncharacterized protein
VKRRMDELLLPVADDDASAPFWEGTRAGELRVQACADCGSLRFPPRPMCPRCQSLAVAWKAMSGRGVIWSFVVPHPPLLPAYAELSPYNVIVVALDEDPTLRLVGNLVADADAPIDSVDPATIEIGQPVQVVFQPWGDDVVMPQWVRA